MHGNKFFKSVLLFVWNAVVSVISQIGFLRVKRKLKASGMPNAHVHMKHLFYRQNFEALQRC